ncbi:MAG: D-alanyl-D-alanine carboxypeptidase DacB precursor [Firmicutes bacterium ADurb.Bin419]|nr:MAG: D-alanyl-D-alanine carboxypeptidase DacB precursor [Firmicutes bacterium ADurb.Bin419]
MLLSQLSIIYASGKIPENVLNNVRSCVVIEASSREILYGKDENQKRHPASTTKIMTAILAIENADLKKTVSVSQSAIREIGSGGTNAGLVAGEKIVLEDALKLMLVGSANDCANIIAENTFGNKEDFIKKMNQKAKEIGANNTTYTNPIGLDGTDGTQYSNQITTAFDLAAISRYAMTIPKFREIVIMDSVTVPPTNKHKNKRTFSSTNKLLKNSYDDFIITGIKTGYTIKAGKLLVCSAKNSEGIELISVVMGSDSNTVYNCTEALLDYGFSHPQLKEFSMRNAPYKVVVSDRALSTEPIVSEDVIYVSVKELAIALKINLDWIAEDQSIILENHGRNVHLGIDKKTAFVDGNKTELTYAPLLKNGISFVPLNVIAEIFGYEISTDLSNKTIKVDSIPSITDRTTVSDSVYYYSNSEPIRFNEIKFLDNRIYIKSTDFEVLTQNKFNLEFFPDSRIFLVDGSARYFDTEIKLMEDRIYVPLASLAKSFGMKVYWGANTKTVHMFFQNLSTKPGKDISELVPEHFVYGFVKDKTPLYYSIGGKISSYLSNGKVEIIRDKDYKWYYVKSGNLSGWTKKEYLTIDTNFIPSGDRLSSTETEYFANNYFKLSSQSNFLVWVDLKKQLINVFIRNNDKWKVEKIIPCATGKNISPTIKGTFAISSNRGTWMPAGSNVWVKNYVGFYSSYFFHSVKVKKNGTLYDGTLGTVASAGCIRMPLEESEWFYNNIPEKTTVFIR